MPKMRTVQIMKNKTCVRCNQEQPIKMFYKSKNTLDGIDYYCKECRKTTSLESHRFGKIKPKCTVDGCDNLNYAKNLCRPHYERVRRHGNTDLINAGLGREDINVYHKNRKVALKVRYAVDYQKYKELSKNGCEVCGAEALPYKALHVDHDHKCCEIEYEDDKRTPKYYKYISCGKCVRGIVCDKCNQAIGRYEKGVLRPEYPNRDKVIAYVEKYNNLISGRIDTDDYIKRRRERKAW